MQYSHIPGLFRFERVPYAFQGAHPLDGFLYEAICPVENLVNEKQSFNLGAECHILKGTTNDTLGIDTNEFLALEPHNRFRFFISKLFTDCLKGHGSRDGQALEVAYTTNTNLFSAHQDVPIPPITVDHFVFTNHFLHLEIESLVKNKPERFTNIWPGFDPKINYYTAKNDFQEIAQSLPGMNHYMRQPCDCDTILANTVMAIVIHLNDKHHWERGRIADWLDKIHDPTGAHGPNLNFEVPGD